MPLPALITIHKTVEGMPVQRPDGSPNLAIDINPIKKFLSGFWLTPDPNPLVLAASATGKQRFSIDQRGHFDWAYIMGTFTNGPVMIELMDEACNRNLQNKPVHSTTIVGSGRRPFRLPESYFLSVGDSQRELLATIRNFAVGVNSVVLNPYGRRFYHKEAPPDMTAEFVKKFDTGWKKYPYFLVPKDYNVNGIPDVIPAGGKATFTFEQDDNADLEATKLTLFSTGPFSYLLRERDKSLRPLSSDIVQSANGWGNAEFPFYLMDSFMLEKKKQLLLDVVDLSGANNLIFATISGTRFQYR